MTCKQNRPHFKTSQHPQNQSPFLHPVHLKINILIPIQYSNYTMNARLQQMFTYEHINMKHTLLLIILIKTITAFEFLYLSVSTDNAVINQIANYSFIATRSLDINQNPTPYNTQPVPAGSSIIIKFPQQYDLTVTTPKVTSLIIDSVSVTSFIYSIFSTNLTISNAILSSASIAQILITVSNVTNPYPTITTDAFLIIIGQDISSSSDSSKITLISDNFADCSVKFNPIIVNTTGNMIVSLTPKNKILIGGFIQIKFPDNLRWSQDISTAHTLLLDLPITCSPVSGQLFSGTCLGSTFDKIIDYTILTINGSTLVSSFSFSVGSLYSPPTISPPDLLTITSFSVNGEPIDTCTTLITGLAVQPLFITLSTNTLPLYINSITALNFVFSLPDTVAKTDYLQIVLPSGSIFTPYMATSPNLNLLSTIPVYTSSNLTITLKRTASSIILIAGINANTSISNYTAPPSTKPVGLFTVNLLNNMNHLKMSGTATLTVVSKIYTLSVVSQSYFINAAATYSFTVITNDKLLDSAMIAITFPSVLTLTISSNCLVANISNPSPFVCALNGSNTVILSSLSTAIINPNTYTFTVSGIKNAGKALTTSSFFMNLYYTNDYSQLSATATAAGISFFPNELPSSSLQLTLSDYFVMSTSVSLNINFTLTDLIPAGGSIVITIPSQLVITQAQCNLLIGSSLTPSSCILSNQTITITTVNLINTNLQITLQLVECCTNPRSTAPTGIFKLYTYSFDHYMIDYSNTTLKVINFLPISFAFLIVSPQSSINNAATSYDFTLRQNNFWDSNSNLLIMFPTIVTVYSNATCINITSGSSLNCNVFSNSTGGFVNITLSQSDSFAYIRVNSIVNPPSIEQTLPFHITTFTPNGYVYATDNTSLSIKTSIPSAFLSFTYTFSSLIYNTSSDLTLTFSNTAATSNLFILSNFQQFVNLTVTNFSCTSSFPLTCYQNLSTLYIAPVSNTDKFPLNTTIVIHNTFIPLLNTTQMSFSSFINGFLASTFSPIKFQTLCTVPCYTCPSASAPTVCLSCYPNTYFTTMIYYYQSTCLNSCPLGTFTPSSNLTCTLCSSECAQCLLSSTSCTECNSNGTYPILLLSNFTCVASCPNGYYKNNSTNLTKYTSICSACVYPCASCSSPTVCLSCSNSSLFFFQFQCLTTCPANVSFPNITSMSCDPCAPICSTCVNSSTICLSCNSLIAPIFIAANYTCVTTCPSPLVSDLNNTICVSCQYPCSTCNQTKTNCTSCSNGTSTYLSALVIGSCVFTCDTLYFANTTTLKCQLCSSVVNLHCDNCLNQSYCMSCNAGYVLYLGNHTCLSQAPSGFANISDIAVQCTSNCSQCLGSISNCSLCTGNYSLYIYLGTGYCYSTCPNSTVSINNYCTACTYPCRTCSSTITNCTSCTTGYLYTNGSNTICATICPNTTFINNSTLICQNCDAPCSSCLTAATICLTCSTGYFYNNTCLLTCPSNTLSNVLANTCDLCLNPCITCTGVTNNCTSCASGYYYFATTNRCYISCPVDISVPSPIAASLVCLNCDSTCFTCSFTQNNCTSCSQNLTFYNFTCSSTCPSGYFNLGGVCTLCLNNCLTCTSAIFCLTCQPSFLFYKNTCVSTCNVAFSIIANGVCTACANGCLNCTSTNLCYQCPTSTALYSGSCLTQCPAPLTLHFNTTSNQLGCYTETQIANETLTTTLTSVSVSSFLPLPFTIVTSFFFICALMSKIQNTQTYITGIGYVLFGCAEVGSFIYFLFIFMTDQKNNSDYTTYLMLSIIVLGIVMGLNAISLIFVTPFLCGDNQFMNWLNYRRRGTAISQKSDASSALQEQTKGSTDQQNYNIECWSHRFTFVLFTIISLVTTYKLKLIIFTKLFKFNCLTAHLQNIQGFKAFNVLSFLGVLHQGLALYIVIKILLNYSYTYNSRLIMSSIDCLVVTSICFIFTLIGTQKDSDFFKVHNTYTKGIDLGHRKKNKDRLKNYKIDEKRLTGLNSRDKLVDMNQQYSDVGEQQSQIIVNHNIDIKNVPKRITGDWVTVHESRTRNKSPRKDKQGNIFDQNDNNQLDDIDSFYDNIDLFHTSVKPSPSQSKLANKKVSNWVEVDLDKEQKMGKSKLQQSEVKDIYSSSKKQANYQIQTDKKLNNMNIESSIVRIQIGQTKKDTNIQSKHNNLPMRPIIKETDSQYMNDSKVNQQSAVRQIPIIQNQSAVNIVIPQVKKVTEIIDLQQMQNNNQTLGRGQIQQSFHQPSFQSILPFIHENGILKDKPAKLKNQNKRSERSSKNQIKQIAVKQNKNLIVNQKVDMAVIANSALFEQQEQINKQQQKQAQQLQNLLDISEIKFQEIHPTPKEEIRAKAQQIKREVVEESNQFSKSNIQRSRQLGLASTQMNQQIVPIPTYNQITHAPKVYRNQNKLQPTIMEQEQFDDKIQKVQYELTKIKEQLVLGNNRLAQKKLQQLNKSNLKKSKKSLKGELDRIIKTKQTKPETNNYNIIQPNNQQKTIPMKTKESLQEIIIIHPPNKQPNNNNNQSIKQSQSHQQPSVSYHRPIQVNRPISEQQKTVEPYEDVSVIEYQQQQKAVSKKQQSINGRNIFDQQLYTEQEDPHHQIVSQSSKQIAPLSYRNFQKQLQSEQQSKYQVIQFNDQQEPKHTEYSKKDQQSFIDQSQQQQNDKQSQNRSNSLSNKQQEQQIEPKYQPHQQQQSQEQQLQQQQQQQQQRSHQSEDKQQNNLISSQSPSRVQQSESNSQSHEQIIDANQQNQQSQIQQQQSNYPNQNQIEQIHQQNETAQPNQQISEPQLSHQITQNNIPYQHDQIIEIQQQPIPFIAQQERQHHYQTEQSHQQPSKITEEAEQAQQDKVYYQQDSRHNQQPPNNQNNDVTVDKRQYYQKQIKQYQYDREERQMEEEESQEAAKQFTVENYNQKYDEGDDDQEENHSIEMRKTFKKYPPKIVKYREEEEDPEPIQFSRTNQYELAKYTEDDDDQPVGNVQMSKISRLQNQSHRKDNANQQKTNQQKDHSQVINMLNKASRRTNNKREMPKEERDQRILIKMNPRDVKPYRLAKQENTNIARKSQQKNKPISKFTFQQNNQQFSEQDAKIDLNQKYDLPKNNTVNHLIRPKNIQIINSMRDSSSNASVPELDMTNHKKEQIENTQRRRKVPQQVREFNFGDQIISQTSNPQNFNSQAQLYKWKQNFVQEGSYTNMRPQDYHNEMPARPVINNVQHYQDQPQQLEYQLRMNSKLKRGQSKLGSKQKTRRSGSRGRGKDSQLRKIYGK